MKAAELVVSALEMRGHVKEDVADLASALHSLVKVASDDDGRGIRLLLSIIGDAATSARKHHDGAPDVSSVTLGRLLRFESAIVKAIKELT